MSRWGKNRDDSNIGEKMKCAKRKGREKIELEKSDSVRENQGEYTSVYGKRTMKKKWRKSE